MKTIDIIRQSTPESAPTYGDNLCILQNGEQLFCGPCSTQPNPFQADTKKLWPDVYAQIDEGTFGWQFFNDSNMECVRKFGPCILVNGGAAIPTVNPNVNHNGEYIATEIFIHHGFSPSWRGSAGCITIYDNADKFFGLFLHGETGKLVIRKAA